MIDLHMHTNCSDGLDSPNELLQKTEDAKLELISITDHNHCLSYEKIDRSIFSGDMITGCEMATSFEGQIIEILGYGVDTKIINDWHNDFYSPENLAKNEDVLFNRILKILDNLGVKYTKDLQMEKIVKGVSKQTIYYDMVKYEENKNKLPKDTFDTYRDFFRNGLANPESPLFCDEGSLYPSLDDTVGLIKEAKGLTFLAHLFEYEVGDNFAFLDRLLDRIKLDGLECYHSIYNEKNIEDMIKYATNNNYYISGGTDYHGKPHRGVSLGTGKGQLHIERKMVNNWIDKVKVF